MAGVGQMAGQAALAAFGQVGWLAGMPADAIATLAAAAEHFAVDAGSRLFAQHDVGDGLYLITAGRVSVLGRTPGDGRVALSALEPGAVLGEFCLLDGGRRSADAMAVTAVSGWRLALARYAALQAAAHPAAVALGAALRRQVASRSSVLVAGLSGAAAAETAQGLPTAPVAAERLAARLHSFPGFDRFAAADWAALAAAGQGLQAQRGTVLAPAGVPKLVMILRGALLWQAPTDGLQLLVHGPGALAGAAAFVAGVPWPARLLVREDAELFCLDELPPETGSLGRQLAAMLGVALVRDQRRLTRVRGRIEALQMMAAA